MGSKEAAIARQSADRNRRQREHARRLRERTAIATFLERRRVKRKLNGSRAWLAGQVSSSRRGALLARDKCRRAAARSRQLAHRARERAEARRPGNDPRERR
jgi:hypothetical protein